MSSFTILPLSATENLTDRLHPTAAKVLLFLPLVLLSGIEIPLFLSNLTNKIITFVSVNLCLSMWFDLKS